MMRHRYVPLLTVLAVLFAANLGLYVQQGLAAKQGVGEELDQELPEFRALLDVFHKVRQYYVEEEEADPQVLWRGAIKGMLGELDPYSTYFPPKRYSEFRETTEGAFGGLGIRIEMEDGWVTVVSPLPNTPAFRAGLRPGDRIYEIEGESTRGMTINDAVKVLKGDPGTDVTISVARQKPDLSVEDLEFTITRDIIEVPALDDNTGMVTPEVAYIRLNDFTQDAEEELREKLSELEQQGMKGLVVDLRYNSGGLLTEAVDVCGLFVPTNSVAVKIEHRDPRRNEELRTRKAPAWEGPLVVLVNRFSASASEIVAGCMQDRRRAVVIGPKDENTYGKGSVQTILELNDGAALKLTTARYLTPEGRNIHKKGIRPDIWVNVPREEAIALSQHHRLGYLPPGYFDEPEDKAAGEEIQAATGPVSAEDVYVGYEEDKEPGEDVTDRLLLEAVNQVKTLILFQKSED